MCEPGSHESSLCCHLVPDELREATKHIYMIGLHNEDMVLLGLYGMVSMTLSTVTL